MHTVWLPSPMPPSAGPARAPRCRAARGRPARRRGRGARAPALERRLRPGCRPLDPGADRRSSRTVLPAPAADGELQRLAPRAVRLRRRPCGRRRPRRVPGRGARMRARRVRLRHPAREAGRGAADHRRRRRPPRRLHTGVAGRGELRPSGGDPGRGALRGRRAARASPARVGGRRAGARARHEAMGGAGDRPGRRGGATRATRSPLTGGSRRGGPLHSSAPRGRFRRVHAQIAHGRQRPGGDRARERLVPGRARSPRAPSSPARLPDLDNRLCPPGLARTGDARAHRPGGSRPGPRRLATEERPAGPARARACSHAACSTRPTTSTTTCRSCSPCSHTRPSRRAGFPSSP